MKEFTCKELGGSCDEVIRGETKMDIAKKSYEHFMTSNDEGHREMRERMENQSTGDKEKCEEDRKKWWEWFDKEWDKKEEV